MRKKIVEKKTILPVCSALSVFTQHERKTFHSKATYVMRLVPVVAVVVTVRVWLLVPSDCAESPEVQKSPDV